MVTHSYCVFRYVARWISLVLSSTLLRLIAVHILCYKFRVVYVVLCRYAHRFLQFNWWMSGRYFMSNDISLVVILNFVNSLCRLFQTTMCCLVFGEFWVRSYGCGMFFETSQTFNPTFSLHILTANTIHVHSHVQQKISNTYTFIYIKFNVTL